MVLYDLYDENDFPVLDRAVAGEKLLLTASLGDDNTVLIETVRNSIPVALIYADDLYLEGEDFYGSVQSMCEMLSNRIADNIKAEGVRCDPEAYMIDKYGKTSVLLKDAGSKEGNKLLNELEAFHSRFDKMVALNKKEKEICNFTR